MDGNECSENSIVTELNRRDAEKSLEKKLTVKIIQRLLSPLSILLLLFYFFSIFMLANWSHNNRYSITGDEPHYLIVTDGIISYGTFEQSKPYTKEFEEKNILPGLASKDLTANPSNKQIFLGPHGLFSAHNIGLPLLLSIPYKVGNHLNEAFPQITKFIPQHSGFVKICLVILSGLIVVGVWIITGVFSKNAKIRVITLTAVIFAYPFIPASNQIYPEILSGIILLFTIIYLIFSEVGCKKMSINALTFLSLTIAYLPWLQIKFSAPALLAACAVSYSVRKEKNRLRHFFIPLIFLSISLVILIIYNQYAFGKVLGPYKEGALQINSTSLMVLLGLHLDRFQGIFFQNISYIITPLFIVSFYRKTPFVSLAIFLIYASIVAPNALHSNWYGGNSFAGRFQWTGAIILTPLVVYALMRMMELYPRISSVFIFFIILTNFIAYVRYTFTNFNLYNKATQTLYAAYPSFIPLIGDFLPAFYNSQWAFSFPINYVWVVIVFFLFSIGIIRNMRIKSKLLSTYTKLGFLFLGGLLLILAVNQTHPHETISYTATNLPSHIGLLESDSWKVDNDLSSGFLSYGPYISLPAGDYIATFHYTSNTSDGVAIGWADVTSNRGKNEFAKRILFGTNNVPISIDIPFTIKKNTQGIEVRFWYAGIGSVSLKRLEIQPAKK